MKSFIRPVLMITGITLLVTASACKSKEEREKEKARKSVEFQQELQQEVIQGQVKDAKEEQTRRVNYYKGVGGTYEGSYTLDNGTVVKMRFRLLPQLPEPIGNTKLETPETVRAQTESLSFNISGLEYIVRNENTESQEVLKLVTCEEKGVKADLRTGSLNITSCQSLVSSTNRIYLVTVENNPDGADAEKLSRSETVTGFIMNGKLKAADYLKFEFSPLNEINPQVVTLQRTDIVFEKKN